jgi:hypothetical protein
VGSSVYQFLQNLSSFKDSPYPPHRNQVDAILKDNPLHSIFLKQVFLTDYKPGGSAGNLRHGRIGRAVVNSLL